MVPTVIPIFFRWQIHKHTTFREKWGDSRFMFKKVAIKLKADTKCGVQDSN